MTCRELLQNLKSKLEIDSQITDAQIDVAMIGNSKEAKANVMIHVEGEMHMIEVTAKDLGFFKAPMSP